MAHFTLKDIQSWDRFYRTNFINCLSGFKSVTLIGTVNKQGNCNLAIFSNVIHIGADPAVVGFINRPREAAPHTIGNIEATGVYTMNHVHPAIVKQAHQTSAKYNEDESEFDKVGLNIEWKQNIIVPFVAESNIKYVLDLIEIIPIKFNGTFLIVGAITDVFMSEDILDKDGYLNIDQSGSVASLGVSGYYKTTLLQKLPYAKP